eukprot:15249725-Alexandrium_andersonii.AAC.1
MELAERGASAKEGEMRQRGRERERGRWPRDPQHPVGGRPRAGICGGPKIRRAEAAARARKS